MDRDDEVLQSVSKLLRDNNINFWACHGTLLGIIRENRLLPWDRDIDLAVWDYETDRNHVAQIFEDAGFKQEYFFADVDSLHFHRVGKNIDINFFKKNNSIGSWKGAVAMEGFFNKIIIHLGHIIHVEELRYIEMPRSLIKRFLYFFFVSFVLIFRYILPTAFKNKINQSALSRISYIGYSYPLDLLKFKEISYKGIKLQVPIDSEKCLELTYGANWRIPKKDYIWHEDASNLIKD
jgi:hypothetical protein